MRLPKKIKGMVNPAGMEERHDSALRPWPAGGFLDQTPPRGAAADDFLDAACMMFVAGAHARGEARPFPDPPGSDAYGIPGRDPGVIAAIEPLHCSAAICL